MSAPQYEPCEHRCDPGNPDGYYTAPCPLCEAATAYTKKATWVALALLVLVIVLSLVLA